MVLVSSVKLSNNKQQERGTVFSVRYVPRLYKEEQPVTRESLEIVQCRRVGGCR
jgi:hypothetical protein